jgi:type I restriction enzyme S subunit
LSNIDIERGILSAILFDGENYEIVANILKPKDNLLKEFDKFATDFFTRQKALDEASNSLSKLRDTLLPKLLSGELRIPDAEKLIAEVT